MACRSGSVVRARRKLRIAVAAAQIVVDLGQIVAIAERRLVGMLAQRFFVDRSAPRPSGRSASSCWRAAQVAVELVGRRARRCGGTMRACGDGRRGQPQQAAQQRAVRRARCVIFRMGSFCLGSESARRGFTCRRLISGRTEPSRAVRPRRQPRTLNLVMSFKRRPERRVQGFGQIQYRPRFGDGQKTAGNFFRAARRAHPLQALPRGALRDGCNGRRKTWKRSRHVQLDAPDGTTCAAESPAASQVHGNSAATPVQRGHWCTRRAQTAVSSWTSGRHAVRRLGHAASRVLDRRTSRPSGSTSVCFSHKHDRVAGQFAVEQRRGFAALDRLARPRLNSARTNRPDRTISSCGRSTLPSAVSTVSGMFISGLPSITAKSYSSVARSRWISKPARKPAALLMDHAAHGADDQPPDRRTGIAT